MKCIYAIPSETTELAFNLCRDYSQALESFSETILAKADDLRALVQNAGGPQFQIDDDDWETACASVEGKFTDGVSKLLGKIFWSGEEAKLIAAAMKNLSAPSCNSIGNWLLTQVDRGRSIVLLAG